MILLLLSGDPFTSILLGGDLSLAPQQLRADVRAAFVSKGEVHVILDGPEVDDIVGVAIWYTPGVKSFTTCVGLLTVYFQ